MPYHRGNQILAANCGKAFLGFVTVRSVLGKSQNIPTEAAADVSIPLKSITMDQETTV